MEEKQIIKGKTQSGEYKDLTVFGGEVLNIYDLPSNATVGDILRYDGSNWIKHTLRTPHYLYLSGWIKLNPNAYNANVFQNILASGNISSKSISTYNNGISWSGDAQLWLASSKSYKFVYTVHLFSQNIAGDQYWEIQMVRSNGSVISYSLVAIRVDNENLSLSCNGIISGYDYMLPQLKNNGGYSNPSYIDCSISITVDEIHDII